MEAAMAQVLVRNLDDKVVEQLKAQAARRGRSLEAELREIIGESIRASRETLIDEFRRVRALAPPRPPGFPPAEELIREDRDSR